MSQQLIIDLAKRYISVYEKISGKKFTPYQYPVEDQIKHSITKTLAKQPITYKATGIDYSAMDPLKRAAQQAAAETADNLSNLNMQEVSLSRGESAFVWSEPGCYKAFVIEGLGTKSLVADAVSRYTGQSHYDSLAQDTVAMIVNDLIVVGAAPQVVNAYFAVGNSTWFSQEQRAKDLVTGWARACNLAGAIWGGGETPTLKDIIDPNTIDLAGAAVGIIKPKKRLTLGHTHNANDSIILIESSGIHANGLTLARAIADKLPKGYQTKLGNSTYGQTILKPTHIYAKVIQDLFDHNIDIHYMVNVTGHGWRKLMRAQKDLTYRLHTIPKPQPLFGLIQKHSGNDDQEMYGNFNMGAGFAVFINPDHVNQAQQIISEHKFKSWNAGVIETGPKQVIIEPKNITFKSESLAVR